MVKEVEMSALDEVSESQRPRECPGGGDGNPPNSLGDLDQATASQSPNFHFCKIRVFGVTITCKISPAPKIL